MANDSSASMREEAPHLTNTSNITNSIKRRAQAVIDDESIDGPSRAIIRYGLEINDPCLPNSSGASMQAKPSAMIFSIQLHKLSQMIRSRKRSRQWQT